MSRCIPLMSVSLASPRARTVFASDAQGGGEQTDNDAGGFGIVATAITSELVDDLWRSSFVPWDRSGRADLRWFPPLLVRGFPGVFSIPTGTPWRRANGCTGTTLPWGSTRTRAHLPSVGGDPFGAWPYDRCTGRQRSGLLCYGQRPFSGPWAQLLCPQAGGFSSGCRHLGRQPMGGDGSHAGRRCQPWLRDCGTWTR